MPTMADLLNAGHGRLTLGCPTLDAAMGGGVPTRCITELTGESTASKTQLCLQMLLTAQEPTHRGGLGGGALYIHTEGPAPVGRLRQMAEARQALARADGREVLAPSALLEGIFVEKVFEDTEQLLDTLQRVRPLLSGEIPSAKRVRLVVVDSISNLFRDVDTGVNQELSERSRTLYVLARLLKEYAYTYDIVVVVTNHVRDMMDSESTSSLGPMELVTSGKRVAPSLGLLWSSCVNMRVFLAKMPSQNVRQLQVVFAPHTRPAACWYRVTQAGVHGAAPLE